MQPCSLQLGRHIKTIIRSKCRILQTVRKKHPFRTLVELTSKTSIPQLLQQGDTYQTLVEFTAKSQIDKTFWKTNVACSNGIVTCVTPSKEYLLQKF